MLLSGAPSPSGVLTAPTTKATLAGALSSDPGSGRGVPAGGFRGLGK